MLNKNPVVKLGKREFRLVPRDHASACAGCVAEGGDQDGLCGALPADCVETGGVYVEIKEAKPCEG